MSVAQGGYMCDIRDIANCIIEDWGDGISKEALPYLKAMLELDSINDFYGNESAYSIVSYFLANSAKYKGNLAKEYKKKLKKLVS